MTTDTESTTEIDPDELRARIERVYMATTMESDPHGALSWFARRANLTPDAVMKWCRGVRTPSGPAIALLELLEKRHGIDDAGD